jgi:peptidoglycan/LPS O-acetylase OafA/YrhL
MKERVASLDMLRGFAAIGVAIPHFLIYFGNGSAFLEAISSIAVEIFFVLSGFVLAPQILLVMSGEMRFGLGTFLVRRWMRTIPPYFMALVFISVLFGVADSADFWRYLSYTQNLFGQHLSNDYYPVAWSLSVEEWFYIAFPALLTAASFGAPRSERFYACAALAFILAITVLRQAFGDASAWGPDVRRVVAFRVDSIAWGFLLYLAINRWSRLALAPIVMGVLAAALALVLLFVTEQTETSLVAQFLFPFVAAAFGAACICFFVRLNPLFDHRAVRRIADIVGRLSYPVYLYHLLVIYLLARFSAPAPLRLMLFCLATGALSAGSVYLFERPILAARPHYRRKEIKLCAEDSYSASVWLSPRSSFLSRSAINPSRRFFILDSDATKRLFVGLVANIVFVAICAIGVEGGYRTYLLLRYPKRFAHHATERSFSVFDSSLWRYNHAFGYDYAPGVAMHGATIVNGEVRNCDTEKPVDERGDPPPSVSDFDAADYKVLVFGDSMTEGSLDGSTWVSLLQSKLELATKRRVRVRNMARDSYAVLQMFDLAAVKAAELRPDLIVFAFNSSALERTRTWRTQLGDGDNIRIIITNDSSPVPDPTFSTELLTVVPGVTNEWCERMKASTPDTQRRDATLQAVFAKRAWLEAQRPKTPRAKFFDLRSSYAYDQIAHHDPFFSQGAKEKPGAALALARADYELDGDLKADIAAIKTSRIPFLMVHLPLGSSLADGQEFWVPKPQWPALLESLEQLVGQKINQLRPHIHVAPADAMSLCRARDNCHPSKFGMEVYAQAVAEIVTPYLTDAHKEQ